MLLNAQLMEKSVIQGMVAGKRNREIKIKMGKGHHGYIWDNDWSEQKAAAMFIKVCMCQCVWTAEVDVCRE